jgi:tetratricopeptide (TPR) repeat protein
VPDTEVQLKAATMLFIAGQFDDARARIQRVLEREPANLDAQILLASASAGLRDLDNALSEIETAIELDPTSAPAQTSLGLIPHRAGGPRRRTVAFEKAVELDPTSIKAPPRAGELPVVHRARDAGRGVVQEGARARSRCRRSPIAPWPCSTRPPAAARRRRAISRY